MNTQRLVIVVIAAIGMLTTFMPWVDAPLSGAMDGTKGKGWISMALFAIPVLVCLVRDKKAPLKGLWLYAAILPGLIVLAFAMWTIRDFHTQEIEQGHPFTELVEKDAAIGFGLYLLILAAVALVVAGVWVRGSGRIIF